MKIALPSKLVTSLILAVRVLLLVVIFYYLVLIPLVAFVLGFFVDAQRHANVLFSMYQLRSTDVFLMSREGPNTHVSVVLFRVFSAFLPIAGALTVVRFRVSRRYILLFIGWALAIQFAFLNGPIPDWVYDVLSSISAFLFGTAVPMLIRPNFPLPKQISVTDGSVNHMTDVSAAEYPDPVWFWIAYVLSSLVVSGLVSRMYSDFIALLPVGYVIVAIAAAFTPRRSRTVSRGITLASVGAIFPPVVVMVGLGVLKLLGHGGPGW